MRQRDIEIWALNVLRRVNEGQPHEDSRVELKAAWPDDPARAARQIAAHANVARGEPILWLIGVDQEAGAVGAIFEEPSKWWPQVVKQFDSVAPTLTEVNVPHNAMTIVALQFDTDRAPYVVKNPMFGAPGGGPISLEVPWRSSTSVRSAKREELLLLLAPLQRLPHLELLRGRVTVGLGAAHEGGVRWLVWMEIYIVPSDEKRLVIPHHHCEATLEVPNRLMPLILEGGRLSPPHVIDISGVRNTSRTMEGTATELIVDGPGSAYLSGEQRTGGINSDLTGTTAVVRFRYRPTGVETSTEVVFELPLTSAPIPGEAFTMAKWSIGPMEE